MSLIVTPHGHTYTNVLAFFCARFPYVSADEWRRRFAEGTVIDAGSGLALEADAPYQPAMRVHYERRVEDEPPIPFQHQIVFQDAHLVVADKPHFLPVVPSGRYVHETLVWRLRTSLSLPALTPIHRIDQDTAGLVVFCVNPSDRGAYQRMFATHEVEKIYEAIALTIALPPQSVRVRLARAPAFMQAQVVAGEANTETEISLNSTYGATSSYTLRPKTGARHQLRAVMAHLGAPIVNDRIYPRLLPQLAVEDFVHTPPLQLLAKSIAFLDPITGERRAFQSTRALSVPLAQ